MSLRAHPWAHPWARLVPVRFRTGTNLCNIRFRTQGASINVTDDARAQVTLSPHTIHSPHDMRHYMRLKPANRRVCIRHEGHVIAESTAAVRLLEVGKDVYDPVVYLPVADIGERVKPSAKPRTHCPLKGNASYFDLMDEQGDVQVVDIGWTYDEALDFAEGLRGLVGFYGNKVVIEEHPLPGTNARD